MVTAFVNECTSEMMCAETARLKWNAPCACPEVVVVVVVVVEAVHRGSKSQNCTSEIVVF